MANGEQRPEVQTDPFSQLPDQVRQDVETALGDRPVLEQYRVYRQARVAAYNRFGEQLVAQARTDFSDANTALNNEDARQFVLKHVFPTLEDLNAAREAAAGAAAEEPEREEPAPEEEREEPTPATPDQPESEQPSPETPPAAEAGEPAQEPAPPAAAPEEAPEQPAGEETAEQRAERLQREVTEQDRIIQELRQRNQELEQRITELEARIQELEEQGIREARETLATPPEAPAATAAAHARATAEAGGTTAPAEHRGHDQQAVDNYFVNLGPITRFLVKIGAKYIVPTVTPDMTGGRTRAVPTYRPSESAINAEAQAGFFGNLRMRWQNFKLRHGMARPEGPTPEQGGGGSAATAPAEAGGNRRYMQELEDAHLERQGLRRTPRVVPRTAETRTAAAPSRGPVRGRRRRLNRLADDLVNEERFRNQ